MKKNKLLITLVQTNVFWLKKQQNFEHLSTILGSIESDIIILPEMFSTGFYTNPVDVAEDENGPTMQWLREMAKNTGISICGSMIWNDNNKFYNRLIFMRPDTQWAWYDKRHRFTMAGEHYKFSSGLKRVVINHLGWRIKPLVCYDLRFPVWARNDQDYDLLIYVANWPESRIDQWKNLLIARAIENQSFVVAVNRIGQDGNGFYYSGMSMAINPRGKIIYQAPEHKQDIHTIEIDLNTLMSMRQKFPVLRDKDLFSVKDSDQVEFWK